MPQAVLTLNNSDVLRALKEANQAMEAYEKGGEQAAEKLSTAFTRMQNTLVTVTDKHRTSLEKLTQAAERQAEVYGKTPIERLVSQRDALIKRLGDEKEMVDRVTASYSKMIEVAQRQASAASGAAGEGGGFNTRYGIFLAKDVMEGRLRNAAAEAINLTSAMSGLPALLTGVGLGFVAVTGAVMEGAKALAEWGTAQRDIQLRTGLTAQELGQFTYAAKAVGTDVTLVERLMRGLAEAADDSSMKGEKARDTLRAMHVDVDGLRSGLVPTSEILKQVGLAFETNGSAILRDKDAMDLFKRAGIESVPFLTELNDNLKHAQEAGYGFEQKTIDLGSTTQKVLADASMRWQNFKLLIEGTAASLYSAVTGVTQWDEVMRKWENLQAQKTLGVPEISKLAPTQLFTVTGPTNSQIQRDMMNDMQYQLQHANEQLKKAQDSYYGMLNSAKASNQEVADARTKWVQAKEAVDHYREAIEQARKAQKAETLEVTPQYGLPEGMYPPYRPYAAPGQTGRVPSLFGGTLEIAPEDIARANAATQKALEEQMGERWKATIDQWKESDKNREQTAKDLLEYQIQMIKLQSGPGSELDTAERVAAIKMQMAKDDQERMKIGLDLMVEQARIQSDADKKHDEELEKQAQKQQEMISKTAESIFRELLEPHAHHRGASIASTLREATIRPINEGLGHLTGQLLQPLIFGGLQDVKLVGGAVPVHVVGTSVGGGGGGEIVNIPLGPMGGAVAIPSIGAGGGALPGGGIGAAPGGAPISLPSLFGGANPASIVGPGGTPGFAPGALGIGGTHGGFGGLLGGFGGFGNIGANLGRVFGIGQTPTVTGPIANPTITGTTTLGGVLGSPAAGLGGMMLAQQSLLGSGAGTGMGILGGAAGGALLGMQFGGPIGAAVGAGVGAAIGLGELLAGVEPQWKEAERLVRQHYHINIDHAEGQRIADIANQSFGGKVSLAVMSPQVRQMLGVYALGTGQQNTALSSMIPHAGSLVEQGGRLYQAATYNMGQAGLYQSSLPTLAGNPGAVTWPTAGSPQQLSLNINGQSAADLLSGRVADVVNPGYVSSMYEQAGYDSDGRVANYANVAQPGLIIS